MGVARRNRRGQRIERRIDELLARIEAAGGCRLVANATNRMHGPALTQAMSFLASRESDLPQWVWVLDSDVVISRPDALKKALERADESAAAIVGESWWDQWHEMDRFLAYSLLIDPVRVWRDGIEPFMMGVIRRSICSSQPTSLARRSPSSPS